MAHSHSHEHGHGHGHSHGHGHGHGHSHAHPEDDPLAVPDITIVGGGPVGCLLACLLKEKGLSVTVYEKREDPRKIQDAGKSINLALSWYSPRPLVDFSLCPRSPLHLFHSSFVLIIILLYYFIEIVF